MGRRFAVGFDKEKIKAKMSPRPIVHFVSLTGGV